MSNAKSKLIVTLRHNVGVDSDVDLALEEMAALCGLKSTKRVTLLESKKQLIAELKSIGSDQKSIRLMTHCLRESGSVALMINGVSQTHFERVLRDIAFGQEAIFHAKKMSAAADAMQKKFSRCVELDDGSHLIRGITLASVLDYSTKMVFTRGKGLDVFVGLDSLVDYLLDEIAPPRGMAAAINAAIAAKKTTLYLTHELHLYKGKFFPRMVRSLMNRYLSEPGSTVVDPFSGSGTTLLEASLLGHSSIGIDVDPTSVMISSHKLSPLEIDPEVMRETCMSIHDAVYDEPHLLSEGRYSLNDWKKFKISAPEPMRGRLIKRGNEEGYDLLGEVENDSAKCLCLISQMPNQLQSIMRVCLSHALTKKLRLRFVGIGNGRFTIDVAKVGILDLFVKKAFHLVAISEAFSWLTHNGVCFSPAKVIRGSAKEFNQLLGSKKVDLVITSPPYIPASSGREHYARARAIPLIFTGAATLDELDHLDEAFIGEMSAQTDTLHLEKAMPPAIRRTLEFLRTDEQRLPKYLPTLNYYVDLEKVLRNTQKCLSDTGRALFVVATSHTFYIHKTKEILHTVDAANAIAELGVKAGLKLDEIINIPLKKSGGPNARPRSTDEYSESVVVFTKG